MEKGPKGFITNKVESALLTVFKKNSKLLITQVESLIDFNLTELTKSEEFQWAVELISAGYIPVIVSNHQSHTDAVPIVNMVNLIMNNSDDLLGGFIMPYAISASSGNQGNVIQSLFYTSNPWLVNHGVIPLPVIREKDKVKYGIKGQSSAALKKILKAPEDHLGVTIFPEGTVQGGRKDSNGNITGMVHAENGLGSILRYWLISKKSFFVLPVGINGTFNIFDPNNLRPTPEAFKALVRNMLFSGNPVKLAQVRVGQPITSEDFTESFKTADDITTFIMQKVAGLLPGEAKGVYKAH